MVYNPNNYILHAFRYLKKNFMTSVFLRFQLFFFFWHNWNWNIIPCLLFVGFFATIVIKLIFLRFLGFTTRMSAWKNEWNEMYVFKRLMIKINLITKSHLIPSWYFVCKWKRALILMPMPTVLSHPFTKVLCEMSPQDESFFKPKLDF